MKLTKEQKEILSKIADIKQVILSNHFDISDLTEQLISTLPFKEGDIVLYYKDEPYMVSKIEPWDEGMDTSHTYRYYGNAYLMVSLSVFNMRVVQTQTIPLSTLKKQSS